MSMLVPILAGLGCGAMLSRNPRRRRRVVRRRNPGGYRKIDIFVGGNYVASTNSAKSLKEAVANFRKNSKVATIKPGQGIVMEDRSAGYREVTAKYADRNPGKRRKGKRKGKWVS